MERKFLLAIYGNQNKKLLMEEMTVNSIKAVVRQKFNIHMPGLDIKYYDNDVDDWVDLDADSECSIQDLKVVKVKLNMINDHESEDDKAADEELPTISVRKRLYSAPEAHNHSRSASPTNTAIIPVNSPEHVQLSRPATPVSESATSANRFTNGLETPKQSPAVTPNTPATKSRASQKEWSKKYRLPKDLVPVGLTCKLDNKEPLTIGERRVFLEAIYNDVSKYKGGMYPTSEMYDCIVDGILGEYPHLLSCGGLPATSARAYWKDKVIFKFGNARKSFDNNHPDVIRRKRKKAEVNSTAVVPEARNLIWGLGNYLPEIPQTEDETTTSLHMQSLQREYRKDASDVNMDVVDTKMQLTLHYRRKLIITDKMDIKNVIEKFPWLQLRHQILKEFERLKPNLSLGLELENAMSEGLKKYRKPIATLLKTKKKAECLKEVERMTAHFRTTDQRSYAEDCFALVGLPLLFKEKPEDVIRFEEDQDCPLYILVKQNLLSLGESTFSVYVEGIEVLDCTNFFQAYAILIAAIYVFNLAYPKTLNKSLTFFQNVLIGLKDQQGQVTLDRRILNVLSSLNLLIPQSS